MAIKYSKLPLSGAGGTLLHVPVADTSPTGTTGTLLHTAPTGTTAMDEVWLWAHNRSSHPPRSLYLKLGGTSEAERVWFNLPGMQGPVGDHVNVVPSLILPGVPFHSGAEIRASVTATAGLYVYGFVNRLAT